MTKSITLNTFWPYQVVVLADQITRHTTRLLKEITDVNLSQWRVMAAVAEKPGRSAAEVVSVTPMDKGIVSRAVATLVDRGYLERTVTETDKRRSCLSLTVQGQAIYNRVSEQQNAILAETFSDADNQALVALLRGRMALFE